MRSIGVGNVAGILPFLAAAYRRRADIIQILDSNGAQNTITGHFEGQLLGAAGVFGLWSSAFVPGFAANNGLTSDAAGHTGNEINAAGEPAAFTALRMPPFSAVDGASIPFGNWDWCDTFPGNANPGSYLQVKHRLPLDMNGAIGYCPVLWRPAALGVTQLRPAVQGVMDGGPANYQIASATLALPARTSSGINGIDGIDECPWKIARGAMIDFTNATNPANNATKYFGQGYKISPRTWTGDTTGADGTKTGGIIGHRLSDEERFRGVAVSPFYTFGGKPTRAATLDICGIAGSGGMTDAALGTWLNAVTISQRSSTGLRLPPMLMVQIIEGGNDSVDTGTLGALAAGKSLLSTTGAYRSAVEVAGAAGNTATGYYNNTVTILRRIRYAWETVLGFNGANLYFLIGCYHPQSSGISAAQWTFVRGVMPAAMASVAASERNVCWVDGYKLGTYAEFGRVVGNTTGGVDGTDFVTAFAQSYSTTTSPFTAVAHQPWYRDPSNQDAHLNEQGYIAWGQRVWGAIMDSAAVAGLYSTLGQGNGRQGRVIRGG